MVVLLTCKNKEDPIKNEGTRVFTTFYIDFSGAQGQITLELVVVSSRNWNSSKLACMSLLLIQACMHVLVTYKNEDDSYNKSCRMTA